MTSEIWELKVMESILRSLDLDIWILLPTYQLNWENEGSKLMILKKNKELTKNIIKI